MKAKLGIDDCEIFCYNLSPTPPLGFKLHLSLNLDSILDLCMINFVNHAMPTTHKQPD
jgi:hypothetical protein